MKCTYLEICYIYLEICRKKCSTFEFNIFREILEPQGTIFVRNRHQGDPKYRNQLIIRSVELNFLQKKMFNF